MFVSTIPCFFVSAGVLLQVLQPSDVSIGTLNLAQSSPMQSSISLVWLSPDVG